MIVPPDGEVQGITHAPLPFNLLEAVNMANHPTAPANGATASAQPAKNGSASKFVAPKAAASTAIPPLTFGARSQRFNPYANSSAKGYYYASPAPPRAPRVRRQSF